MDPTAILVAVIGLVGLLLSAAINAWVLVKVSVVKSDVAEVRHATNSMKDELVRLSRAEGKQEGKDEVHAEAHAVAAAAVPLKVELKLDDAAAALLSGQQKKDATVP